MRARAFKGIALLCLVVAVPAASGGIPACSVLLDQGSDQIFGSVRDDVPETPIEAAAA